MASVTKQIMGRLTSGVAAQVDRAASKVIFGRTEGTRARSAAESLGPVERLARLAEVEATYAPYVADPEAFFPRRAATITETFVRPMGPNGVVLDLAWPSPLPPLHLDDEALRARLAGRAHANEIAHARLFAHRDAPRPAIILLHGYLGGDVRVEERAFPVRWLFDRGLDVVLGLLPHHGKRGVPRKRPLLPASDPRLTIEGFRHGIVDLRSLVAWLRARGSVAVGAMGMSLGGYTSALLATVEDVDFAFPMIPLASIADFAEHHDRLVGTASQRRAQHEALERAHAVVSPLSRPSKVDPTNVLVLAGKADRITPIAHAEKLAAHLGGRLIAFDGGHLFQAGRDEGFREIARLLGARGWLDRR
jgi:pimeloyl-ACP methyl ester carboxylesterase